jgi:hypothetical protein
MLGKKEYACLCVCVDVETVNGGHATDMSGMR